MGLEKFNGKLVGIIIPIPRRIWAKKFLTYGSLNIPIGQKDATSVQMGKKIPKNVPLGENCCKKIVE